jgi:hypothetical protein
MNLTSLPNYILHNRILFSHTQLSRTQLNRTPSKIILSKSPSAIAEPCDVDFSAHSPWQL